MSVRKRSWITSKGISKTAWQVDYVDGQGTRRHKQFDRKKEADAFHASAAVEVRHGIHVADRASITVTAAGKLWMQSGEADGLERSTLDQRRQHLDFHITPLIGSTLLNAVSGPAVRAFEDALRTGGRSPAMVRKVLTSLGSILADAGERGLVARNAVRELRRGRKRRSDAGEKRAKGKLRVGVDIPTPAEIGALLPHLTGRYRPVLLTAIFAGLRASELRGLRWSDIDFEARKLHVRQRADRYREIGAPKSEAGKRVLPIGPMLLRELAEWRKVCPSSPHDLVFPDESGGPIHHSIIVRKGLVPAWHAAGITGRYGSMHPLRHFYASWLINRKVDGGWELPMKTVQEWMGHSKMDTTADIYGHLFPSHDLAAEMAAAEAALLLQCNTNATFCP
jgi:integrase